MKKGKCETSIKKREIIEKRRRKGREIANKGGGSEKRSFWRRTNNVVLKTWIKTDKWRVKVALLHVASQRAIFLQ